MKVGQLSTQLRLRRQLISITTVLTRIVRLLIAFYLLIESACSGDMPRTKTMPMPTGTTTYQDSTWKLAWSDEFDGPQGAPPDPSKWTADVGGNGWGSHQLAYNTDNQNAYQDGKGNLVLEARKDNPAGYQCWHGSCEYTSARITTRGHFSFTYGLLEAKIKIPYGQGIWSVFWLLGSDCETVGWPTCGEIDVMENIGKEPALIHGSTHAPENFTSAYKLEHGAFTDDFHTFALQWDTNHLYFFLDSDNYAVLDRATLENRQDWVYDHPFDIVLNIAVGGDWPGSPDSTTIFPQKMYVSYVKLYTDK